MNDDNQSAPEPAEEFDVNSLAESLLSKEEEKPDETDKGEEAQEPEAKTEEPAKEKETAEDDKPEEGGEAPATEEATDDKPESDNAEEDNKPLTRADIRQALREEQQERESAVTNHQTFAGKVRNDLKEALKPDSNYTTIALDDGTPISSVSQLTQVVNPETNEPYTRDEAASLLLDAQRIVNDNMSAYEKQVDELTDLNVSFKEEADRVDELYGDVLKAFPDVAKDLLEAYQKTFKLSSDGSYVENVPVSPLEFYGPALRPFRNAADQLNQQQEQAKAEEAKVAKQAAIKAEQEDRGDLGGTAGSAKGKPDPLGDALTEYLSNN